MEEADVSADQMGRTVQFLAKTYISWQIWKETEPELFWLFERTFKIELEMPLDQIGRLDTGIKDGSLAIEIDKIHGIDPVLHRGKKDVKISKFQVSLAPAQPANIESKKSIEALEKRLLKVEINERSRSIDLSVVMRDFLGYSVMMMKKFEELDKKVDEGLVSLSAKCDKMEKTVLKYK
ncbi:hypothetical protein HDV01_006767 [Terramyces sp. JEL0728]|nr:hypothetical protein HDV01_006767 [Terramyces sp. JEL0728]